MLNSKSFLTVDFGAGTLKVAEFEINEAGGLLLKQYGLKSLGEEGAKEETREKILQATMDALIAEKGIRSKNVNVCAPGFHVFAKFVKLPPVEPSKVTQIIQYEAQQNVPFPLSEVVWDYQILGSTASQELEVLLVAIKSEIVEGLFKITESSGLKLQLTDVSPAALCNAFRYNYGDLDDCTMLLDIGAKTSNLLFFEKGKVFSRSINLGANSITQDFKNDSKLSWVDAEAKKISEGFVSLGGAYEEPENAHQAAISKIARQFMTRLHIQVNQTMQFYRGQQGGSAPVRLFLSGGASLMPYTAQFFAEKLNLPVEYFNPLRNVQIDPSINLEELARVAHSLGEVIGLGLRNLANCPVELNLMPDSTLNWIQFNQKKPYFLLTGFGLAGTIGLFILLFNKVTAIDNEELEKITAVVTPAQNKEAQLKTALKDRDQVLGEVKLFGDWISQRYYWADVFEELHKILIQVETDTTHKLGTPTGVWVEKFISADTTATDVNAPGATPLPPQGFPPGFGSRYGYPGGPMGMNRYGAPGGLPGMPVAAPVAPANPGEGGAASSTNEVSTVTVLFRGVDLTKTTQVSSATSDIAYAVESALKNSPLLDNAGTHLQGNIDSGENTGTFSFSVVLKLKHPMKL